MTNEQESNAAGWAICAVIFAALATSAIYFFSTGGINVSGAGDITATNATSSTILVGPQQIITVFAANEACAGRVIGTHSTQIQLSFNSGVVPSASVGFPQTPTTTVAYPNNIYGCGAVTAYGLASTTITRLVTN